MNQKRYLLCFLVSSLRTLTVVLLCFFVKNKGPANLVEGATPDLGQAGLANATASLDDLERHSSTDQSDIHAADVEPTKPMNADEGTHSDDVADRLDSMVDSDGEHANHCHICKDSGELLCCDFCPLAYHLGCLTPPMENIPDGSDWKCPECRVPTSAVVSEGDSEGAARLLTREELIEHLLSISPVAEGGVTTVGMVRML